MSPAHRVLFWLLLLAFLALAALIATAPVPGPACSDAFDPDCATPYTDGGKP